MVTHPLCPPPIRLRRLEGGYKPEKQISGSGETPPSPGPFPLIGEGGIYSPFFPFM
jgi:hypothetical protein